MRLGGNEEGNKGRRGLGRRDRVSMGQIDIGLWRVCISTRWSE
jgi:hypothetical protein